MITLKYKKTGKAIYLSHIDVLRHLNRTFRRAGIEVEFSKGFNPHMLTKLGVPLPLGTYSEAEYVTVATDLEPEDFLQKYNQNCVEGMEGIKAFKVEKNPNLAGKVAYADYLLNARAEEKQQELEKLTTLESLVVNYPTRKEPLKKKDIGGLIKNVECEGDSLRICMDAVTLRADVLAVSLSRRFDFPLIDDKIVRVAQYVKSADGSLLEVDKFLENC